MTEYTRGIPGVILRGRYTTRGHLNDQYQEVTIVGPGIPGRRPVTDDAPAVVVAETIPGHPVLRPAPTAKTKGWHWAASDAYVSPAGFGSDWKNLFGDYRPVALHDRHEG